MGKPSGSRFQQITRCVAYCAPEGAAILRLAEFQDRQEREAQQRFEHELAELYRESGWTRYAED